MRSLLLVTMLATLGCKARSRSSQALSLTNQELSALCGSDVERGLLIVAHQDFAKDMETIQDVFNGRPLISPTFADAQIEISKKRPELSKEQIEQIYERCKFSGQYAQVKIDYNAAVDKFPSSLNLLKNQVIRRAGATKKTQFLVAVTSHGTPIQNAQQAGIVFGDGAVKKSSEFVSEIFTSLFTECLDAQCSSIRKKGADEVIILVDACYSGDVIQAFETYLNGKLGYRKNSVAQNATRYVLITSSNANQTSVGALQQSGKPISGGTIYASIQSALDTWIADTNNDGFISWEEIFNYVSLNTRNGTALRVKGTLFQLSKSMACYSGEKRGTAYGFLRHVGRRNGVFDSQAFADMINDGSGSSEPSASAVKIQRPLMSTNYASLGQVYLAVSATDHSRKAGTASACFNDLKTQCDTSVSETLKLAKVISAQVKFLDANPDMVTIAKIPNNQSLQPTPDPTTPQGDSSIISPKKQTPAMGGSFGPAEFPAPPGLRISPEMLKTIDPSLEDALLTDYKLYVFGECDMQDQSMPIFDPNAPQGMDQ
jgi:hypothetical protein